MTRTLPRALLKMAYVVLYIIAIVLVFASFYPVRGTLCCGEMLPPSLTDMGQSIAILVLSIICYGLHFLIGKKLKEPR